MRTVNNSFSTIPSEISSPRRCHPKTSSVLCDRVKTDVIRFYVYISVLRPHPPTTYLLMVLSKKRFRQETILLDRLKNDFHRSHYSIVLPSLIPTP